jgi:hypothetical protein
MLLLEIGCYRPYPPPKPNGFPIEAAWAGGLDGGGWVHCSTPSPDYNECTTFDEDGRTTGPGLYVLKRESRAARQEELKYTYVTGKVVGLQGGLELERVDETR